MAVKALYAFRSVGIQIEMGRRIAIVILLLNVSIVVEAWRPFTVRMQNESYRVFEPKIVDFKVTLATDKNDVQRVSGYLNIQKEIPDYFIHIRILLNSDDSKFDLVYLNQTFSVCKFLDNRKLIIFGDILYQMASEYVELPKRCPILKRYYAVTNATLDANKLPPVLPERKMLFQASTWFVENGKKIMLSEGSVIGSIEKKYRKKN